MKCTPKYAENIIVFVKYKTLYNWYITDKELWFLDLRKLIEAYEKIGYKIPNPNDFSERFNIDIVNRQSASDFLKNIGEFQVSTECLNKILINKEYKHISEMFPSLYVNFDEQELISYFPELASYENFVPDDWNGKYEDFTNYIPREFKYWIIDEENIFKRGDSNE